MEVRRAAEVTQWALPVTESSQAAQVRRRGATLARELGFGEARASDLAILLTEAANNLVKHATGGEIVLRLLDEEGRRGIEVLALDRGPGIRDLAESLRDGHSTKGTSGTGLGAIRRQADAFDIYSQLDRGTGIMARVWAQGPAPSDVAGKFDIGAVCLPVRGEEVPGDAWAMADSASGTRLLLVDGVGHGPLAAEAAAVAVRMLGQGAEWPLGLLIERMHEALRPGRGAVGAIAEIDLGREVLRFMGVGNVAALLWSPARSQHLVSMNGTLGHGTIRAREFSYPWPADALLVLHSDGLGTRWSLDDYPGLAAKAPALVAGILYRDFVRGRDDVTVMAVRQRRSR
jgi:anti-sigma regulatory factor (Ser/Thr protein kinase)